MLAAENETYDCSVIIRMPLEPLVGPLENDTFCMIPPEPDSGDVIDAVSDSFERIRTTMVICIHARYETSIMVCDTMLHNHCCVAWN